MPPDWIKSSLEALQENPQQGSQLTNVPIGKWRIRVGDYRIRYVRQEA
jgi:mRNA-degrading endonuclease RelE of RelBE toxin-antitoxin system